MVVLVLLGVLRSLGAEERAQDLHTPEGHYQFAEGLFFRKFYDLAEKELRDFLTRYPDHTLAPDAMYRLIISLRNQSKKDDTLSAINQFQARWPEHEWGPRLFLWKGELLHEKEKYAAAEACFRRATASSDTLMSEAAVFFMAQCQEKQGKSEEALASYRLIAEHPFDAEHEYRPYALFALALGDQRRGSNETAGPAFARLTTEEHVPPAVHEEALYRLGETFFAREMYKDAVATYERSLAEKPQGLFARDVRKRLSWAYYLLGDYARAAEAAGSWRQTYGEVFDSELDYIHAFSLVGVQFYEEALPLLNRLAEDPRVPVQTARLARYQRIVCLDNLKRLDEAAGQCEAFVADFPMAAELSSVQFIGGRAYLALGQHEKAVPLLRKACEGFLGEWPSYEAASGMLCESLAVLKRYGDAAAVYREVAGKEGVTARAYCLFKAGECERQAGNSDAAILDFEGVLQRFPGAAEEGRVAMQNLGELYSSAGQLDRATAVVQKLIDISTGAKARLLFFLGYLHYRQDQFAEAARVLQAALAEPDAGAVSAEAKFYLGGALLEIGRGDDALTIFGEILSLPETERPDFPPDLLFRLDELYFAKDNYAVSEAICRWLMASPDGATVYRATLRLADILATQDRLAEAETRLGELRQRIKEGKLSFPADDAERPRDDEVASVLSEIYLLKGQPSKALVAAEQCMAQKALRLEYVTRARWVLGEALLQQDHPLQALPYAVKTYILDDSPVYSPRGMVLAIRILVREKRMKEARTTLVELRKRYPVYAESMSSVPEVKEVMAAEEPPVPAVTDPPSQEPPAEE